MAENTKQSGQPADSPAVGPSEIVGALPMPVILVGAQGEMSYVNPAAEQFFDMGAGPPTAVLAATVQATEPGSIRGDMRTTPNMGPGMMMRGGPMMGMMGQMRSKNSRNQMWSYCQQMMQAWWQQSAPQKENAPKPEPKKK